MYYVHYIKLNLIISDKMNYVHYGNCRVLLWAEKAAGRPAAGRQHVQLLSLLMSQPELRGRAVAQGRGCVGLGLRPT